ncbi:hypothetical protein AAG589_02660 [Isoptericola sp. F-RaC21]|uniref:hypothetical protein n=1 Tax=Isoptericola sp. F-RaC21 TaxID=3141452 RepID=UPI00315C3CDA
MTTPTPQRPDAAAAVVRARSLALTSSRDRVVHARAVAGIGLMQGAMAALTWGVAANDLPWSGIVLWAAQVCWLAAIVTVSGWRESRTGTTPRHARRTALLGVVASGVLLLAISWAVHLGGAPGVGPAAAVAAGVVVALPSVLAGRRIRMAGAPEAHR